VRYFGLLLMLPLFVGCEPGPTAGPGDIITDTDSNVSSPSGENLNRPVLVEKSSPAPNPATDPADAAAVNNPPATEPDTRKDNTAVNDRDRSDAAKTPLDQGQDSPDIKLTANIRQKIVGHSGMSINARNIKIISEDGSVTLRGPVKSQEEKDLIDKFAKESAGEDKVDNQLEIAP
jgi:hyperosmotically inducible protein